MPRQERKIFSRGRFHIQRRMCDTCIFRDGNLMNVRPGVVERMVAEALLCDTVTVCHETTGEGQQNAVCNGFYTRYRGEVAPLRLADTVPGLVAWAGGEDA